MYNRLAQVFWEGSFCSADNTTSERKMKVTRIMDSYESSLDEESGWKSDTLLFWTLHVIATWEESETVTKRANVAIVTLSGFQSYSARVVEEGRELELIVRWTEPLANPKVLHGKWMEAEATEHIQVYHTRIQDFKRALKTLRSHAEDGMDSAARIVLPFPVYMVVEAKQNLGFCDSGSKIVYIELKAYVDTYELVKEGAAF